MICKHCGQEFFEKPSKYASGDLCSKICARAYSTSKDNKLQTKLAKCIICGIEEEVNKRSSLKNFKCKKCKNKIVYCKICGSPKNKCKRKDICKKHRILPALIKYFGFNKNTIGTEYVYEEFERIRTLLIEDYYDNLMSMSDICKKYQHNRPNNLQKILSTLNIQRRSLKDSSTLAIFQNKIHLNSVTKYKSGWHETWNGKKVFYRSSYELDYCLELDEKKIDYEVEKLRILYWDSQRLKQRVAIPDFYLPETNEIVEIKSNWTYDEQNMKDKVKTYKKHGYNFKLILNHKEFIFKGDSH